MGLERVVRAPYTIVRLRRQPLGAFLDDFCDWLLAQGFTELTVRLQMGHVSHLNEWMGARSRWSGLLSRRQVEDFFRAYPYHCRNRGPLASHLKAVRHSIHRFVRYLRHKGMFDPEIAAPVYQPLLSAFLAWMRDHRHCADGTVDAHRHNLGKFLQTLGPLATHEGVSALTAERVETFFIDYAHRSGRAARHSMQGALRMFFRFCSFYGYTRQRLDCAVPTLRTYKLAGLPRGLDESQAKAVLRAVDRRSLSGRRDYAILQLLYCHGVRGGQVRALRMDDIRWAEEQILFRSNKNGKDVLWPLTTEVGSSLLDYLKNARPSCPFPEVFLTCRAPYQPLPESSSLSEIVRRRIVAAGIDRYSKGAHAFRHAFASRMVARGFPFKAVADGLGHRHLSTTFIYTKVDFKSLERVALEWPMEVQP